MIEVIALAPDGFSRKQVGNIRQAVVQAEWLLETGAAKIGIYVTKSENLSANLSATKPKIVVSVVPEAGIEPATKGL